MECWRDCVLSEYMSDRVLPSVEVLTASMKLQAQVAVEDLIIVD